LAPATLRSSREPSFLGSLRQAADGAAGIAGIHTERFYEVSKLPVRVRLAGPRSLLRLLTALSHLSIPARDEASLSVDVWTDEPEPDGPWRESLGGRERAIRGAAPDAAGWFLGFDGAVTAFDRSRNKGYYWRDRADRDPWHERAAPLSPLFGAWLAEHGVDLVHAGAVGSEEGCVLLAGRVGAGKSHVALACLQAGFGFLGDDTCLLAGGDPPIVRSLYSSVQPSPATLASLPHLPPMDGEPPRAGKAVLFVRNNLVREAPLRAIAILTAADRDQTRTRPASPGQALAALAPSSLLQVPGAGKRMLEGLSRIVQTVPCVQLESGADPARVADGVGALL
jgi:hypothetical protein